MKKKARSLTLLLLAGLGAVIALRGFPRRAAHPVLSCTVIPKSSSSWVAGSLVPWPPQVGKPYPDFEMTDQSGRPFRLSSLKGKVILLEPEAMSCVGCQAWDGGHEIGALGPVTPQEGLTEFGAHFKPYTRGIAYDDPRLAVVHVLYFNFALQPTTAADAKQWAAHFHFDRAKDRIVLAGSTLFHRPDYYPATYKQVCGWQLIDKEFILRANFLCNVPSDDLYRTVLPMVPALIAESK